MASIHAEAVHSKNPAATRPSPSKSRSSRRRSGTDIYTLRTLYGHALAMTQEAVPRYSDFATHAADLGFDEIADLFKRLSELSEERACELAKATRRLGPLKFRAGEHSWLYDDFPVPGTEDFLFRMMTPRLALEIALRAEARSMTFFEHVSATSKDMGARELAIDLGREKGAYVAWLTDSLSQVTVPFQPDEDRPGDPTMPQVL